MQAFGAWRDALGILSVVLAVLAALIYILQTLRGEIGLILCPGFSSGPSA